jgi:hypothetical protein
MPFHRSDLLFGSVLLAVAAGCGSHPAAKRSDASPTGDTHVVTNGDGPAEVAASPDVGTAAGDARENPDEVSGKDATGASDTPTKTADAGATPDALPDERLAPDQGASDPASANDLLWAPDAVGPIADALTCTAAQEALRASVYEATIIPFADTPAVVQDFLTAFLSRGYVEEHFRFSPTSNGTTTNPNLLDFAFIDGCYTSTVPGQIQWNVPIYQGKIRYLGPSQEWRILISEEEARAQVEAAGCDASNLGLAWAAVGTPLPGVNEYSGLSDYPIWQAGGQSVEGPSGLPAGSHCTGPVCNVHASTGVLAQTPRLCGSPG